MTSRLGVAYHAHCCRNKRQNINIRLYPHLLNAYNGVMKHPAAECKQQYVEHLHMDISDIGLE